MCRKRLRTGGEGRAGRAEKIISEPMTRENLAKLIYVFAETYSAFVAHSRRV